MMLVRRSHERLRDAAAGHDARLTFGPNENAPFDRFGHLELLREGRFAKQGATNEPRINAEVITYVHAGTLAFEDSRGLTGMLKQGDFQRMTAGMGLHYSEMNISTEREAHVFQFSLTPNRVGLSPGHEKRHFTVADRRGRFRVVASPAGTESSLRIHQDAYLYSAILTSGQHVVHPIAPGRRLWLHVVFGSVTIASVSLKTGDGVGISREQSVALTVTEPSELLLLDLGKYRVPAPRKS